MWDSDPYAVEPEFMKLPGFQLSMLRADILHVFHLGVGRDMVGSALRILIRRSSDLFPGRNVGIRLRNATHKLLDYCKANGYNLSLRKLTSRTLNFGSKKYPELRSKGYDCFVLLRWLCHELQGNMLPEHHFLYTLLWCADTVLSTVTNSDRWLDEEVHQQKLVLGDVFCRVYIKLAGEALVRRQYLWRVRPKFHLWHHMLLEDRSSRGNFCSHSTWLDEDFLKWAMAIKKKVHRRSATARTLQRWLMGLPGYFAHASQNKR